MICGEAKAIEATVESERSSDSVAAHLRTCAECRSYWEGLQALRQELLEWPAVIPDDAALGAIRAEVLQKLAARRPWGPRLGWAAVLIVAASALVAGWGSGQRQSMPELLARFEAPAAPPLTARMPPAIEVKPAAPAPRFVQPEEKLETPPVVRIAAIIPADPETGSAGGVMLELESRNPNVVLYFLAENQGD